MALSFCSCSRAVGGRRALRLSKVPAAICGVSRCYRGLAQLVVGGIAACSAARGYDETTAVPALMACQALDEGKNRDLYGRVLAARSGRPAGDLRLRLAGAALSAALSEAARYWAEQDGAPPLTALMDQAVTTFEPLLNALQSDRDGA